jgi:HlyD family secretion protein
VFSRIILQSQAEKSLRKRLIESHSQQFHSFLLAFSQLVFLEYGHKGFQPGENAMFKKKRLWIIGFVITLVLGGGYYYYANVAAAGTVDASQTQAAMQTAVARRGNLVVLASGTGQVATASQMGLGFDESGTLIELNVSLGDGVRSGDVLARLQTANSEQEIAASISDAELVVIQAQQTLSELKANVEIARTTALSDIATYSQDVRDAQYTLENYSTPLFLQGLDAIQGVDQTKAQLDAASAAFEPYKYYPVTNATRKALLVTLNEAQTNYDSAVKRLNYEYALQVAQANLDKARQEYDQYKGGPVADDLALAEAELANAQAKLALAKEAHSVIELIAPMEGTVMAVDANVGEAVGTTPIITLADLKSLQIEVYLDESDLDKAVAGYEAEVTFDALPDQTFTGKVVIVSPGLETVSNVQAVKVIVQLDEIDSNVNLPVGLNAAVDVISGRAENAVLVPVEALRDLGDGEYAVFVVVDGEPTLRVVQVGLQDVTYAEILSGVAEGDTVSTGITQTQ